MNPVLPEWLEKQAKWLIPEIQDEDKWVFRTAFNSDVDEVSCIYCEATFLPVNRFTPDEGAQFFGVSHCSQCKRVYWFELV